MTLRQHSLLGAFVCLSYEFLWLVVIACCQEQEVWRSQGLPPVMDDQREFVHVGASMLGQRPAEGWTCPDTDQEPRLKGVAQFVMPRV